MSSSPVRYSPATPNRARSQPVAVGPEAQYANDRAAGVSNALADYANRQRSWLRELFPTGLDKALRDHQLRVARNIFDIEERLIALACTSRYEAAREEFQNSLKVISADSRERYIALVAPKLGTVSDTIEAERKRLVIRMRGRKAAAESYSDMPELQEIVLEEVRADIRTELKFLSDLHDNFRESIRAHLKEFETPFVRTK